MKKNRLDVILVEKQFYKTRERAKSEVMAGKVLVNNIKITKAGTFIKDSDVINVLSKDFPYVSRGALKLKKALRAFNIDVSDKVALDIGSSTGGFTEVLLENGSYKVFAVDVGTNQLAWKLRSDLRVIVYEKTNARYIDNHFLGESVDVVVTDVSFISLELIIPSVRKCLKLGGEFIALIKPQFEAGKDGVSSKGIVKSKSVHFEVVSKIILFAQFQEFDIMNLTKSPIRGAKGNVEFLIHLRLSDDFGKYYISEEKIEEVIFSE